MSRSFRKRPFASLCGKGSQKVWKQIYNRSMRRSNRVELSKRGEDSVPQTVRETMDVWSMPQDGTRHYASFEHMRHKYPRWWNVTDYRDWWRWVKAK